MRAPKQSSFRVSDEFLSWAESLAGLLTTIETKHGGADSMIEDPQWDQGRTPYAISLIFDLHLHLERIQREMVTHVSARPF